MESWKSGARSGAAIAAVVLMAGLGPALHGQVRAERVPRALDVLAGRGSELGVSVREVDRDGAKSTAVPRGVLIDDVVAGGPAEKAGIRKGDVIIEFDGERVRSVRQFTRLVDETPAGRRVPALLVRGSDRVDVGVELREGGAVRLLGNLDSARVLRDLGQEFGDGFAFAPPPPPAAPRPPALPPVPPVPGFEDFPWRAQTGLGIRMSALTSQLADYFGASRGVLVTSVEDNSAAHAAGFKAGDVLTAFNGAEVSDPADLRSRIQRLQDGDEFTADVLRQKKALTLKGKIERRAARGAARVL